MTPERLHYRLVRALLDTHACPSNSELAATLGISQAHLETLFRQLEAIHGIVLHPHVCEPWILHPFSLTPTLNWVAAGDCGWWAPCIWCALGIAAVVRGEVAIYTRIAGESEAIAIRVINGYPETSADLYVHFAIPPARAWDNVHQHCSMVLPFDSPQQIDAWCDRHQLPKGEPVPLQQVAALARAWYGAHADPDWHKWTIEQAQAIFHNAGLRSAFWNIGSGRREF